MFKNSVRIGDSFHSGVCDEDVFVKHPIITIRSHQHSPGNHNNTNMHIQGECVEEEGLSWPIARHHNAEREVEESSTLFWMCPSNICI